MTNQGSQWLSIRDAAIALGVSELTVRRRIKDGRIAHRLTNGKYFVSLNGLGTKSAVPSTERQSEYSPDQVLEAVQAPSGSSSNGGMELGPLLAEHARLAEVVGRARLLEEQLRGLEQRHVELQQGALSLANRNGWLESKLEEREASIKLLTDGQRSRSWWKRVFSSRNDGV